MAILFIVFALIRKIKLLAQIVGNKMLDKIKNKVIRIQELRRSNAATSIPNKKKYTRKVKHKNGKQ